MVEYLISYDFDGQKQKNINAAESKGEGKLNP